MTHNSEFSAYLEENLPPKLEIVDRGVDSFATGLRERVSMEPPDAQAAVDSCISVLERGGKRLRGALTVAGYMLYDGPDMEMIGTAAGAIEGIHTHLLVMDDVQDNAELRRGGKAAHVRMRDHFEAGGTARDPLKLGSDTIQTAGFIIHDKAQSVLLNLRAEDAQKVQALTILNDSLVNTGVGQLRDILPMNYAALNADEILKTATLKTAYYSFSMPLKIGAVLAGAAAEELPHFDKYALGAGLAYQLQDDILGVFGSEHVSGKSRKSDITEGKATWLLATALERADEADKNILLAALGNTALDDEKFDQCQNILRRTGALDDTRALVSHYTQVAIAALDSAPASWAQPHVRFLHAIALYGAQRQN